MKLTWYGHAAFRIETGDAKILIDPFFTGNPTFPESDREQAIEGLTHIAITHGHGDHIGDSVAIAKQTGAKVISNYDLIQWLQRQGIENVDFGNTGGTVHQDGFSVTWVQAFHSSGQVDEKRCCPLAGHAQRVGFPF